LDPGRASSLDKITRAALVQRRIAAMVLAGERGMRPSLILSANALPQRGGQGLNLYHMVRELEAYFDLRLFCQGSFPPVSTEVVPPSQLASWVSRIPLLRRWRDLTNRWSDVHFDHYVSQRLPQANLFQGVSGQCCETLKAAKALGCRTVVDSITVHIDDFVEQQRYECARFKIRPATTEGIRLRTVEEYRRADLIRVLSERARQTFVDRGLRNVVVARPRIDVSEFPRATFEEARFRVSFVGLLEPWKGFHYLVEAFNRLELPGSELVFWGATGSRPVAHYFREQMSRNPKIQIRPVEVRKCYGEVYGKSSVLVHPSLSEGFGYAVAEAMASGLPVITTPTTGASELIVDGKNGYVVPPRDPQAIRDRLAHLAAHPALLQAMGAAARETMRSRNGLEWQDYAAALQRLAA
jgi:glycosyltransferase involved in cell wall biosynthesis